MSASLHVPIVFRLQKIEDLTKALLQIQAKEAGRVKWEIHYDPPNKSWVLLYYPIRNLGGDVM